MQEEEHITEWDDTNDNEQALAAGAYSIQWIGEVFSGQQTVVLVT